MAKRPCVVLEEDQHVTKRARIDDSHQPRPPWVSSDVSMMPEVPEWQYLDQVYWEPNGRQWQLVLHRARNLVLQ